jgi:hypothetical protein
VIVVKESVKIATERCNKQEIQVMVTIPQGSRRDTRHREGHGADKGKKSAGIPLAASRAFRGQNLLLPHL